MPKGSHFGLREKCELERERRETPSLYDLRRLSGRNPSSQDLKPLYATRATRGLWNHKISPRFKVRVFTKTEKKAVSREITLIEVGFLFYSV